MLFGLQGFVIKAFCKLCLATYAVNAVLAVALWPAPAIEARPDCARTARAHGLGDRRREPRQRRGGLERHARGARGESRWGAARRARGERRSGPAGGDEALRAEVQRLHETLDDPQKYNEYLTAKSEREFDTASVQTFELAGVPVKGAADARIQVVEFSDFLCPYCRAIAGAFKDFLPQSQGRVSVRFKNYPLDKECNAHMNNTIHVGACWVARGGICAQQQGKFWTYHDRVFENPPA